MLKTRNSSDYGIKLGLNLCVEETSSSKKKKDILNAYIHIYIYIYTLTSIFTDSAEDKSENFLMVSNSSQGGQPMNFEEQPSQGLGTTV